MRSLGVGIYGGRIARGHSLGPVDSTLVSPSRGWPHHMARTEREPETGLKGILSTVGGTPLLELERLMPGFTSRVFAKVERFNPGGSVKDRSALNMVATKIRSGELVPG